MTKVKIKKADYSRVLLTETLPYEIPVIFSNVRFRKLVKCGGIKSIRDVIKRYFPTFSDRSYSKGNYYIPYDYKIRRTTYHHRTLSVLHPDMQITIMKFYEKYASVMIDQCSRSQVSLRSAERISSGFSIRNSKNDGLASSLSKKHKESIERDEFSSTFFKYRGYPFIYKFYDSYQFHRLEKRFDSLLKFDISKCFHNIYTHSLSWAVKSKSYAKENTKAKSFENEFDLVMRTGNFQETNGIIVGPEVSRVFAEVILQRIDLISLEKIKDMYPDLNYGTDYVVKRYVDDYFIFSNEERLNKKILEVFQLELEKYKLYINENKTESLKVPFITPISIAKVELRKIVNKFIEENVIFKDDTSTDKILGFDGNTDQQVGESDVDIQNLDSCRFMIRSQKMYLSRSNWFIRDIKCIVKSHEIKYQSVAGYLLVMLKRKLLVILQNKTAEYYKRKRSEELSRFIYSFIDVVFFVYSMDPRVRTTYILSQLIIDIHDFLKDANVDLKHNIFKKISDECINVIKNETRRKDHTNIEWLNLLVALKKLGDDYLLSEKELALFVGYDLSENSFVDLSELDYFEIISTIFYIANFQKFSNLKRALQEVIINKFKSSKTDPFISSELTCLFFDLIVCPFLDLQFKRSLVEVSIATAKSSVSISNLSSESINNLINGVLKDNCYFVDWDAMKNIRKILQEKELNPAY